MKISRFFFIAPKEDLAHVLRSSSSPDVVDLAEEFFWTGDDYDRGALSTEDLGELVKVLFLNRIQRLWSGVPEFDRIFCDLTPTKEHFDKGWTLRRVELETTIEEELEEAYSMGAGETLTSASNSRIQVFLKNYRSPAIRKRST